MTDAEKMMTLFAGLSTAHGTHGEPELDENHAKWAIKKTARTLKQPVTLKLWQQHLEGERPLGIVCINEQSQCRFGGIDVDEYREDLIGVVRRIEDGRLPIVPCRSKSGGLHLWLFLSDWQAADRVQAALREVAASLGLAGSEIFPKQTQVLAERGDVGNWIVMPYFGSTYGGKLKEQVGVKHTGAEMTIGEFLTVSGERTTTLEDLLKCVKKKPAATAANGKTPFHDAPPCLQHLAAIGVPEGGRNNTMFQFAIYLKKKYPEGWEEKLDEVNRTYFTNPLDSEEVAEIKKSNLKKNYEYKCKDEPMQSFCNVAKCRGCKFGVGNANNFPVIYSITRLELSPPLFFVQVPAGRIEMSAEQLQSFPLFNLACMTQKNVMYSPMKANNWSALVTDALAESEWVREIKEIKEKIEEVGIDDRLHEALEDFLTNRQRGERVEDVFTGRPFEDTENQRFVFRMMDFDDYLRRRNFRDDRGGYVTRRTLSRYVESCKGKYTCVHIQVGSKTHAARVWYLPASSIEELPEFHAPATREAI